MFWNMFKRNHRRSFTVLYKTRDSIHALDIDFNYPSKSSMENAASDYPFLDVFDLDI